MVKSDRSGDIQYGALPYRVGKDGGMEVMLLTSRGAGRWVIPKGWPMIGRKPRVVALTEARQEAGIKGIISRKPIGSYHYAKTVERGEKRLCECFVFCCWSRRRDPPGGSRGNGFGRGFQRIRRRNW